MYNLELNQIFLRIFVAIATGGIIGLEREIKNKPAGFITHTVLCVGAAIISIIQIRLASEAISLLLKNPELAQGIKVDTGRLIAQVVSGVGFLGAGTIIQNRGSVKGITTAATLWLTACLGIAVGLGYFYLALGTAFSMTLIVTILKKIELLHIENRVKQKLIITYIMDKEIEKRIKKFLESKKIKINGKKPLSEIYNGEETERKTIYVLMIPKFINIDSMLIEMEKIEEILKIMKI